MAPQILVVDDDRQIARLLRSYLEQAGYAVLVAYEGDSALHMIRENRPDLVLLDLMLPGQDGWTITRIIRSDQRLRNTPVIMLTARVEDTDKIVGLELGADDYIVKPFNPREMVARVRSVLRRSQRGVSGAMLRLGSVIMDVAQHQVSVAGQIVDLTPTEFALTQFLMENAGRVFSRQELIEKALGYSYEGSERTIDSHIKNLRAKLALAPEAAGYITTVYGVGYRMQAEL